ncbi:UNVERIFIED_CONTAM: hypothetical protein GTU68_051900 [Idotea baltica]|nr:hypothetical protein [Idotea baltica]
MLGAVNSANWHHQTEVLIPQVGWTNGEEQHYTNRTANSFVDNKGHLNIVAKSETYTDQGLTKKYTSARLNSKFAFTYGRIDVRAKLPIAAGTWPAIWTLGKNISERGWPACGEIDIMEHGIFPGEDIDYINSALHTPCCHAGNPNQGGTIATNLDDEFHVYSLNWSPDQITFILDGVGFYTYNPVVKDANTWPFFEDQFILLNVAIGGIAGSIAPGFVQGAMVIDYVRVYQNSIVNATDQNTINHQVQVYPNPANDLINITSAIKPTSILLYNAFGKKIRNIKENTSQIDVSDLDAGVYFIEVLINYKRLIKKIIIL